jgi:hypothetical protein
VTMQFLTESECIKWMADRGRSRPTSANSAFTERIWFPKEAPKLCWWARQIAGKMLEHREPCLLWIEEWGIGGEELLHLYYRLRESYGDRRLLADAPGHLFLGYETENLATYLQVAMLNGWGGLMLTHLNYINTFFSHDEFLDVYATEESSFHSLLESISAK